MLTLKGLLLTTMLAFHISSHAQVIGSFTDERDGEVYEMVSYEIKDVNGENLTMTWMAQNLNYEIEGSYCRNDSIKNCEKYGRLYIWPAATKACPPGWHLPSDDEWTILVNLYGGMDSAGRHLKSKSDLWARDGKGTNKSLFNAMPFGTGTKETGYPQFGLNAIYWSSSEKNEAYAWDWNLVSGWKRISHAEGHKFTTGNSVRCVKD